MFTPPKHLFIPTQFQIPRNNTVLPCGSSLPWCLTFLADPVFRFSLHRPLSDRGHIGPYGPMCPLSDNLSDNCIDNVIGYYSGRVVVPAAYVYCQM